MGLPEGHTKGSGRGTNVLFSFVRKNEGKSFGGGGGRYIREWEVSWKSFQEKIEKIDLSLVWVLGGWDRSLS